ncbi:MAG TPA: NAD(P)H-dependent oxidoreductase [Anaerolineaceae bacterium]|nr:NAD(P)H-dependent oxidoreductase [Anaerolineaceae bacterium]
MNDSHAGNQVIESREPIRFLVFSASLRTASLNSQLARLAAKIIEQHGGIVDLAEMADFDVPSYDQDTQDADGYPPGAEVFHRRLEANDAFVIASPEYNNSMPGLLKNAIDWESRYRPQPFNERHGLLLSASPSMVGGNRGLWALRQPLEHLGARIFPDMFSLAQAHKAFNPAGDIADPQLGKRLDLTIKAFMDLVEAAKHYPCVKKAWFEFLGEQPDKATERVE